MIAADVYRLATIAVTALVVVPWFCVEVARLRRSSGVAGRRAIPRRPLGNPRTVTVVHRGSRPYDWQNER